jgi:uncharacterized protein (DUF1330 family)
MPTVTSFTRIKSDDAEGVVKNLKEAKKIIKKRGAEFLRVSRFHTGPWIGDWLVVVRFPNWEAHGKAQEAMAKDPAWAKMLAMQRKLAR